MKTALNHEELIKSNDLVNEIVAKNEFKPVAYLDNGHWKIGYGTPSFEGEEIDDMTAGIRLNEWMQGWVLRALNEGMDLIEAFFFAKLHHGFKRTRKRILEFFHKVLDGEKVAKIDGMEEEDFVALTEFWGDRPNDRVIKRPK